MWGDFVGLDSFPLDYRVIRPEEFHRPNRRSLVVAASLHDHQPHRVMRLHRHLRTVGQLHADLNALRGKDPAPNHREERPITPQHTPGTDR